MDKTIVPSNNHRITPSHWHCTHLPCKDSNPGSGKRQLAVSGNALDHTAIGAGPKWWETASSQWQCLKDHSAIREGPQWWETASSQWQRLRPHGHRGRPSVARDIAVSGNALDHTAIRAGPQWWEAVSSQLQRLWDHPTIGAGPLVRDS